MTKKPTLTVVPARRYPQWQTFYEQRVTAVQQELKAIETLRPIYTAAMEGLLPLNLTNDLTTKMSPGDLTITIQATEADTLADLHNWNLSIGKALVAAGLREDPEGTTAAFSGCYLFSYWAFGSNKLYLFLSIPDTGLKDHIIETIRKPYTSYATTYKLVPRTEIVSS